MATETWESKWLQPKWEEKPKEFNIGGRLDHCHLGTWKELIHVIAGSRTAFFIRLNRARKTPFNWRM